MQMNQLRPVKLLVRTTISSFVELSVCVPILHPCNLYFRCKSIKNARYGKVGRHFQLCKWGSLRLLNCWAALLSSRSFACIDMCWIWRPCYMDFLRKSEKNFSSVNKWNSLGLHFHICKWGSLRLGSFCSALLSSSTFVYDNVSQKLNQFDIYFWPKSVKNNGYTGFGSPFSLMQMR